MDATGTIYILLFFVFTLVAILLYWKMDKTWPGGNVVSLVAFGLFVLSFVIPDKDSRELNGLNGFLRINGIIGILLGVFAYIKHRRTGGSDPGVEARRKPKGRANRNKCPRCGLVNLTTDTSCKRCGAEL